MAEWWTAWFLQHGKPPLQAAEIYTGSAKEASEKNTTSRSPSVKVESDPDILTNPTLERVLAKQTKSPLSFNDFYLYLKHVESSQQHLEFYVWFKDYESRYLQALVGIPPQTRGGYESENECGRIGREAEKDQEKKDEELEFSRYVESIVLSSNQRWSRPCQRPFARPFSFLPSDARAMQNYTNKLELQLAAKTFLDPDALKALNIPATIRKVALNRIAASDSPATLRPVADHVLHLLRSCSHPNFIRLGIGNGTLHTLCMVTIVGVLLVALGFLTVLLIAFVSPSIYQSNRWRALAAIPFWVMGFSFLLAGLRGSCLCFLLFARRQELPWERLDEEKSSEKDVLETAPDGEGRLRSLFKRTMLFDGSITVQDDGWRNTHVKILLQSVAGAIVVTVMLEGVFLWLPVWK